MTAPRLESCYFGPGPEGTWARLAEVLATTAATQCPTWQVSVRSVNPAPRVSALGIPSHARNTQKMDEWHRLVMDAADGDRVLLIDADTCIVRPLDDVWDLDFDYAYTVKASRFPFNSGVVFLRVSERVRQFVTAWRDENARMLNDRHYHTPWRTKYGGINQAALGAMLDRQQDFGLTIQKLPCAEWNCEDSSWATFDPAITRIVHVKSGLRRAIFGHEKPNKVTAPIVEYWHALEAQSVRRSA